MKDEIGQVVTNIIINMLSERGDLIKEINDEEDLSTFNIESMDIISLILELESYYNIEFENEDLIFNKFSTKNNIVEMVRKYL